MKEEKLIRVKVLGDYVEDIIDDFKQQGDKPKLEISSIPEFSKKIWGLKEGELMVIGARTSQGKSSFVAQIAWDVSDINIPVLFLSLEMDVPDLIRRLFCNVCMVNAISMINGEYNRNAELRESFNVFCQLLKARKLMITSGIGDTFGEVIEMVEMMEPTPKVVIVDYIQSIRTTPRDTREQTNEYIRQFRQLALERKFCGILVSQINRGAMDSKGGRPYLHQLKNTGVLEEHADRVLLLHYPHAEDNSKPINDVTVNIAKNRNGATGEYQLNFTPQHYRFEEKKFNVLNGG